MTYPHFMWIINKERDKERKRLSAPPIKATLIQSNGKKIAEAYRDENGTITWVENKIVNKDSLEKSTLSTNQKIFLINNFRKAKERLGFSWKENIVVMTSIIALVIIVISLMVFWGDIAQPALDSKEITKGIVTTQNENLKLIRDMNDNIQRIENKLSEVTGEDFSDNEAPN